MYYFDVSYRFYIDIDVFKYYGFGIMVYYM
jgi:hypothetical protein